MMHYRPELNDTKILELVNGRNFEWIGTREEMDKEKVHGYEKEVRELALKVVLEETTLMEFDHESLPEDLSLTKLFLAGTEDSLREAILQSGKHISDLLTSHPVSSFTIFESAFNITRLFLTPSNKDMLHSLIDREQSIRFSLHQFFTFFVSFTGNETTFKSNLSTSDCHNL